MAHELCGALGQTVCVLCTTVSASRKSRWDRSTRSAACRVAADAADSESCADVSVRDGAGRALVISNDTKYAHHDHLLCKDAILTDPLPER